MALPIHQINRPVTSPTITTPAAILDRAIVTRNSHAMLNACHELGVGFRAHVKSHKTLEIAKLQVGHDPTATAHFVVSTLVEAENLAPYIREQAAFARKCSILHGIPLPLSSIPRLLALAQSLPPKTVSILLDNPATLAAFCKASAQDNINIFIKIDTGYHRAGIATSSPKFQPLVEKVVSEAGDAFKGFYSHFGHSYAGSSEDDAAEGLLEELRGLEEAARAVPETFRGNGKLVLTMGATPTATVAQSLASGNITKAMDCMEVKGVIAKLKEKYEVELHAGVYPLLDLQQVATHARPETGYPQPGFQPLSKENIGLKILVEVTSVYDEREKPEALISAGSLALGREPCKSYPGWGIVTRELGNKDAKKVYDERGDRTGWIVGRISQEHGVLTWEGPREECNPLTVGDKLLIWPNHACIAGSQFPCYLVVDSDQDEDKVYDVWGRWRGW